MKEMVRVRSSGNEVIASGMAYTFEKNGEIEISLEAGAGKKLYFEFRFRDEEGEKQSIDTAETETKDRLTLTCINFNNVLGTGMKRAVKVGDYEGKQLYLTFRVYGYEEQKKLEYTFFKQGE